MTSIIPNTPLHMNIGIMGAAGIARKNIAAIQNQESSCKLVAIASRSSSKANNLHDQHVKDRSIDVHIISGDDAYDRLIELDDVEAIYIPIPVFVKKNWIIKALQAKKHVLCEKPVAKSAEEYLEMLAVAKENNRYIMDGTMFVHNNRTSLMLDHIAQRDVFGNVTRINAEFTFKGDDNFHANNIRISKEGDFHGCIGDLGWYCIRLAQLVFTKANAESAKRAQTTDWRLNDAGVPIDVSGFVFFQNDNPSEEEHVLSFHCSFLHPLHQRASVVGSKQSLEMKNFVVPKEGNNSWVVHGQSLNANDENSHQSVELTESGSVQEVRMWRNFNRFSRSVETNGWDDVDAARLSKISLQNQQFVDALMESIALGGKAVDL